jgi:hypothetical protein
MAPHETVANDICHAQGSWSRIVAEAFAHLSNRLPLELRETVR